MAITQLDLQNALRSLGLSGQSICVHSSLRSFGYVEGGAETVVQAFLEEGSTLMVPAFSWGYAVPPPAELQIPGMAGITPLTPAQPPGWAASIPLPAGRLIGIWALLRRRWSGILTGYGEIIPFVLFAAVGPQAEVLIAGQRPLDVYAPFGALAKGGGFIILMGVGLNHLTLVHAAEKAAGRVLFRRWANGGATGQPIAVEAGGCSDGFEQLAPILAPVEQTSWVGPSFWRILPAQPALTALTLALRQEPSLTRCDNPSCDRCRDAVAGGPLLA